MIAVDTSALMAILLGEPEAAGCRAAIAEADDLLIAAPNLTEALIVAAGRELHGEMALLIDRLTLTVVPFSADLAAHAYSRWGKGHHRAALNICDVFAYALASERACPLLFVGKDFAQTDIVSALA